MTDELTSIRLVIPFRAFDPVMHDRNKSQRQSNHSQKHKPWTQHT